MAAPSQSLKSLSQGCDLALLVLKDIEAFSIILNPLTLIVEL